MVIYKIINLVNNKIYVGSTKDFNRRIKTHFRLLESNNHHSNKLQNSFNKYGIDSFETQIIEEIDDENKLIDREQYWIDTLKPELNITLIAGLNSHIGLKRSDETKKRISESLKGKKLSEEHKESVRKTLTGRKLSEEHKKNIKESLNKSDKFKKSRENSEMYEQIKNTRIENGGYVVTDEMKKKISETLKSKKLQSAISIKIEKYSIDGDLICTYDSMLKAEIDNNLGRSSLYYNIVKNKKEIHKGYIWKIVKL